MADRLLRDPGGVPVTASPGPRPARVSVVVPARDEAATLPLLLRSLRRLTTPVHEVVVVDDGSSDATAAVARDGGAVVVPTTGPPPGWTGKSWACDLGVRASSGDVLLFLDADTVLAPTALDGLLALHERHGGLVSVQPFHDVVEPYEQLSSYFNVVSLLASGAFGPHPQRRPMAFGPCLVTSRADYDRSGGHAAVRGEILDDVRLAAAYARAGLPVHCALGEGSVRMRMYPGGVGQLAEGWTKNFASGAAAAAPGASAGAALWVAAHHVVALAGVRALGRAVTGHRPAARSRRPAPWALAWVLLAVQLRSLLARTGSFRWWTWAAFPAPLLAFDVVFARSLGLTLVRRSVRWRGREVPIGAGRPGDGAP